VKIKLSEKKFEEYDEIFDFIIDAHPDWEKLITDGKLKVKTNQDKVQFTQMEQILEKFNLRITDISYSDYYGIFFGIEKLATNV
jgi:acetolactate synthase small subunit